MMALIGELYCPPTTLVRIKQCIKKSVLFHVCLECYAPCEECSSHQDILFNVAIRGLGWSTIL